MAFSVADTGIGIAPKDLSRVGQPFVQIAVVEVEQGRTRSQGTGLGLAISRALVELHGGSLAIESTLGEGTRITVTLPLAEGRQDTAAAH